MGRLSSLLRRFEPRKDIRRPLHDLTALEREIYNEVPSAQNPEAMAQLSRAVRYLEDNQIGGDFVECGVYLGASAVCMIRTLQACGGERNIWLYDTFNGMPEPAAIDRLYPESDPSQFPDWDSVKRDVGSTWMWGPLEAVQENIDRTGYPDRLMCYVKGMVEDTIPTYAPDQIALLRLDTDFYSSTKHELVHLYPRVVSGGVVIIDDYGAFDGARKATDEYIRENRLRVLLARIDEHVRMWVKP